LTQAVDDELLDEDELLLELLELDDDDELLLEVSQHSQQSMRCTRWPIGL
jgi:hypothetical protein